MTPGRRPDPIGLTVVAGPLGAGKTRLINAALATSAFAATRAIANERGRTPLLSAADIGADLPSPADAGPCLCCARGAFAMLLETVLRALDNGRMPPFGRLLFEAAGAADPLALLAEIAGHPYLSRRFVATGIVAVLPQRRPEAAALDAARRQAAAAAAIVAGAARVPDWLGPPPPAARLIGGSEPPADWLAGIGPFDPSRLEDDARRRYRAATLSGPGGRLARDL